MRVQKMLDFARPSRGPPTTNRIQEGRNRTPRARKIPWLWLAIRVILEVPPRRILKNSASLAGRPHPDPLFILGVRPPDHSEKEPDDPHKLPHLKFASPPKYSYTEAGNQ